MPSSRQIKGNGIADGRVKIAADKPDSHGVECLRHSDKYGMPLPASLAHPKKRISQKRMQI